MSQIFEAVKGLVLQDKKVPSDPPDVSATGCGAQSIAVAKEEGTDDRIAPNTEVAKDASRRPYQLYSKIWGDEEDFLDVPDTKVANFAPFIPHGEPRKSPRLMLNSGVGSKSTMASSAGFAENVSLDYGTVKNMKNHSASAECTKPVVSLGSILTEEDNENDSCRRLHNRHSTESVNTVVEDRERVATHAFDDRFSVECPGDPQESRTVKPGDLRDCRPGRIPAPDEEDEMDEYTMATIAELQDPSLGQPAGEDVHDEILRAFFIPAHCRLPTSLPDAYMHVVDSKGLMSSSDPTVWRAYPRLCDGIATVLFGTGPQCLDDFLDSRVETFEWRCEQHSHAMLQRKHPSGLIRREGGKVWAGTYANLGFQYRWYYYVEAEIDWAGKWRETYSATGTTPIIEGVPDWHKFQAEDVQNGQNSANPNHTLWAGRTLARHLLQYRYWYVDEAENKTVVWSADGKATQGELRRSDGSFMDELV